MLKLLIAALLAFSSASSHAQREVRIVGQEGGERFFPLLRSIYASMGLDVNMEIQPSARALASVNRGYYDAEVGRIPDISRNYPNLIYTKEPLLGVRLVAMIRKGSDIKLASARDLKEYRVGYLIGMSVSETFVRQEGVKAIAVATHQQLSDMLEANRIDVALMGTAFKDSPVYSVGTEALHLRDYYVYHIFNRKFDHLVGRFDDALKQAKKDGRYEKLLLSTYK